MSCRGCRLGCEPLLRCWPPRLWSRVTVLRRRHVTCHRPTSLAMLRSPARGPPSAWAAPPGASVRQSQTADETGVDNPSDRSPSIARARPHPVADSAVRMTRPISCPATQESAASASAAREAEAAGGDHAAPSAEPHLTTRGGRLVESLPTVRAGGSYPQQPTAACRIGIASSPHCCRTSFVYSRRRTTARLLVSARLTQDYQTARASTRSAKGWPLGMTRRSSKPA